MHLLRFSSSLIGILFVCVEDANIISPFLDLGPFLRNQKESKRGGKKQTNSLFATAKAQAASDLEW